MTRCGFCKNNCPIGLCDSIIETMKIDNAPITTKNMTFNYYIFSENLVCFEYLIQQLLITLLHISPFQIIFYKNFTGNSVGIGNTNELKNVQLILVSDR